MNLFSGVDCSLEEFVHVHDPKVARDIFRVKDQLLILIFPLKNSTVHSYSRLYYELITIKNKFTTDLSCTPCTMYQETCNFLWTLSVMWMEQCFLTENVGVVQD